MGEQLEKEWSFSVRPATPTPESDANLFSEATTTLSSVLPSLKTSPNDLHESPLYKKRKIEDTEDSLILNKRKYGKGTCITAGMFTQQVKQDDPKLKHFREENPTKYNRLEKRTSTRDSPKPSLTQKRTSTTMCQETWALTQSMPVYSPASLPHISLPTQTLSDYSPASPLDIPLATQTQTSGLPTMEAPGFCKIPTQFPLKEELNAINELMDSIQMDRSQTSMINNYIQDFMKKF